MLLNPFATLNQPLQPKRKRSSVQDKISTAPRSSTNISGVDSTASAAGRAGGGGSRSAYILNERESAEAEEDAAAYASAFREPSIVRQLSHGSLICTDDGFAVNHLSGKPIKSLTRTVFSREVSFSELPPPPTEADSEINPGAIVHEEQTTSPPTHVPHFADEQNQQRLRDQKHRLVSESAMALGSIRSRPALLPDSKSSNFLDDDGLRRLRATIHKSVFAIGKTHSGTSQPPAASAINLHNTLLTSATTLSDQVGGSVLASAYDEFESRLQIVENSNMPRSLTELLLQQMFLAIRDSTSLNEMVNFIEQSLVKHEQLRTFGDWYVCVGTHVGVSVQHAQNLLLHVCYEGMHFVIFCTSQRLPLLHGLNKLRARFSAWRLQHQQQQPLKTSSTTSDFGDNEFSQYIRENLASTSSSVVMMNQSQTTISGTRSCSSITSSASRKASSGMLATAAVSDDLEKKNSIVAADKQRYIADTLSSAAAEPTPVVEAIDAGRQKWDWHFQRNLDNQTKQSFRT